MENWKVDAKSSSTAERMIMSLAGVCDGAATLDGQGFSGFDAHFGHSLANRASSGQAWTYKQAQSALKLLRKYQGQLGGKAFMDTWIRDPVFSMQPIGMPAPEGTASVVVQDRRLTSRDALAVFQFRYDPALVPALKTIRGEHRGRKFWASWDAAAREWTVPVNDTSIRLIMGVATEFNFEVEPRFTEYLAKIRTKTASSEMMLAMNDDKHVTVIDGSIQIAVADAAILKEFENALSA